MSDEKIPSEQPGHGSASDTDAVKPAGEWQMPKPVFRQSGGYLPKGFQKKSSEFHEMDTAEPNSDGADEEIPVTAPTASSVVQDQPSLSEEFSLDEIEAAAPVIKKKGGALRIIFLVLAILAMLAIVVVILAAVYLWFFLQAGDSQNLN